MISWWIKADNWDEKSYEIARRYSEFGKKNEIYKNNSCKCLRSNKDASIYVMGQREHGTYLVYSQSINQNLGNSRCENP